METTIKIKPLSVNRAWQGRRFMSPEYKEYRRQLMLLLPNLTLPNPPYGVYYEWGLSSTNADLDNPVKPFQDALQEKYRINDKDIIEAFICKRKVKKGEEYITFNIYSAEEPFLTYPPDYY